MQEDDLRESSNVEDRRGGGGGGIGGVGAGGLGIGAVLVLTLIGWVTGINPAILINGAEQVEQSAVGPHDVVLPGPSYRWTGARR